MNVKINGEKIECQEGSTLMDLIKIYLKGKSPEGIAAALNNEIVFKQNWDYSLLKQNDEIEIVHAVQGG